MKETDVINLIKQMFPLTGDDAYWEKGGIAMSVDSSIQGRHFLLDRANWIEEGVWNSVAGAITDVAAVGSNPELIMASFCFPKKTNDLIIKKAVKANEAQHIGQLIVAFRALNGQCGCRHSASWAEFT